MGYKWMVYARQFNVVDGWQDELVFQGQSGSRAVLAAIKAKRSSGYVKIKWR